MLIRRQDAVTRGFAPFVPPGWPAASFDGAGADRDAQRHGEQAEPQGASNRLAELEEALEREKSAREAAVEAAFARGKDEGRKAADQLGAERLALLREELAAASQACLAELNAKADLAIEIARAAVHKILGEGTARAALVEEIARHALVQVSADTLVNVRVSKRDFGSDEELRSLGSALGNVDVVADDDLPSGGCVLNLTLGTLDASLGVQLSALDRELGRLAPVPGAAG